jgi:tetratricopeptide (TPR) repeat protein
MRSRLALLFFAFATLNFYSQTVRKPTVGVPPAQKVASMPAGEGELERHLSAAQGYQLAGDLEHAFIENRAVLGTVLRQVGLLELENGNDANADKDLTASIAFENDSTAHAGLAVAYLRMSRRHDALSEARAAVALDPNNSRAHQILASLYYSGGDYQAALPELELIFQQSPDFDSAYLLGLTYLRLKQIERAKLLFEEMDTSVKSKKADLYILFGQAYEQTDYPDEAERAFTRALEIDPKVLKAHFYKGFVILQHGGSQRIGDAGKEFENELRLTPTDFHANFFAGVAASTEGDHKKAVAFLERAVAANPKSAEAYLFLGQSQVEINDLANAEKSLRLSLKLSEMRPDKDYQNRRTHFMLGRLLARTNRKAESDAELAKAREIQGKLLETDREEIQKIVRPLGVTDTNAQKVAKVLPPNGNASTSISGAPISVQSPEYKKIKQQLSEIAAQAYHNLGVISVQQGDMQGAIDKFQAASGWKPDLPGLDRNWGIVCFRSGHFDKAAAPLERHLKTNPTDDLVRKMLGSIYYFTKDYKRAVSTLTPIEKQLAADSELGYFFGVSLVQLQIRDRAVAIFNRLTDQNPRNTQARFYAAQGFVLLGDYARALKEYTAITSLDPQMKQVHYDAGQALIRMNRLDEAEKEFRLELQLDPSDALAKYHLAFTMLERNIQTDEVVRLLNEAIDAKPDYADAHYQLGKLYIAKGDMENAIGHLETAVQADPKKEYIHYQLSIAYRKANRAADADRELKTYSDLKAANRQAVPSLPQK